METSARTTACLAAVAVLVGACTSDSGQPYAHESMRHPTAAEQLFGTTGEQLAPAPVSPTVAQPAPTMSPTMPAAPLTVPQPVARTSPSDGAFAQELAGSNAAEIELARLAYVRAQSPEVRDFARQMLIDHRDMTIKLDNFALERGHLVAWQIEPEQVATIDRLRTSDSATFDRAYMDEMVAAHIKAVSRLETQAAGSRETAGLANEFLPTVRHHLEMARELDAQL